ncbi:hypothetical protein [Sphaerisporangium aureirubrum]|uniref:ABC transporter permease n=1 Tax=Sphaerisporangium aureirubrum TaxID=1544736 RepID=A0ABW1NAE9_9ACTN
MSEIRTPTVWSLPWHTLRLAGRCLLPLVMWFSVGELARFGLLVGGTELSHGSMRDLRLTLTMLVFLVMVMIGLLVSTGMFLSLRGALYETRARRAEGQEDEKLTDSVGRTIVPFTVLYLSWGWQLDDVRAFLNTDIERQSGDKGYLGAWADYFTGADQGTAQGLTSLNFNITLIIMLAAFLGRYVLSTLHERRGGRTVALLIAFCELAFFYYGVQVIASRGDWVGSRAGVSWWHGFLADMSANIPGWSAFWSWVGEIWPQAWEALILPGAWLTVAILMYGAYAEDAKSVIKDTRLEGGMTEVERAFAERSHSLTRRTLTRLFGRWAHWVALAHTVRLTVRGGAPLFGLFAVCFAAIKIGEGYAARGLEYLLHSDFPLFYWNVLFVPINFAVDLGVTVLTTCLLAATFDVAAGAERRRAAAPAVSGRSAEPARSAPRPDAGSSTVPVPPGPPVPSGPR